MIAKIIAAISAIPKLIDVINGLIDAIERANMIRFMQDSSKAAKLIDDAKTREEYEEAARKLAALTRRI